jgi:Sulfotransferase family
MTPPEETFPGPILIGGSARSGTHAMGRLLDAHPRYHLIGTEARFHSSPTGLPDLLSGDISLDGFLKRCRGIWWRRGFKNRNGMVRIIDEERFEAALSAFEQSFPDDDPWGAARTLVADLLERTAALAGKPSFAEVSGSNITNAPTVARLLPRARFINMLRDGRAVAAGHLHKRSLTDDPMRALQHWEKRVRAAHAAIRRLPPERVLTVELDDLAARDRDATYARVVDLLELEDDAPMRAYFEASISPEGAHFGRWRERMAPPDARRVDRRYRRLVRELRRDGITWVREPEDGGLRVGPLRVPVPGR